MNKRVNNAFFSGNRKGQGLSTNAIILIILGVIVLVVLILGFTIGWNRLLPFVQSNNVENIQTACSLACSTGNVFDYCETVRDVRDGIREPFEATCQQLSADEYQQRNYGISACATISCLAEE